MAARAKDARSKLDGLGLQFDLAFSFLQVSIDDPGDLSVIRRLLPDMPEAQMRELATVLISSVAPAACRVRWLRDVVGVSYFTFHKSSATSWESLAKLVSMIKVGGSMTGPVMYGDYCH